MGGAPAFIGPPLDKGQLTCDRCSSEYCFIAQLYANLPHSEGYERMLYLFACISPECVKRSDCAKVFRSVVHSRNPYTTFATDQDFKEVQNKSDDALRTSKFASLFDDEDDEE